MTEFQIKRELKSVAIIALGPSMTKYMGDFFRNDSKRFTDEVWTINHGAHFLKDIDMVLAMDDPRHKHKEYGNYIPKICEQGVPIVTSTPRTYANMYEYPLREIVNDLDLWHFDLWASGVDASHPMTINNSCAYALAYALWLGCTKIWLYGFDFGSRPQVRDIRDGDPYWRAHHLPANMKVVAEPGEDMVTFFLGYAHAKGVKVRIAPGTHLMNQDIEGYYYGYFDKPLQVLYGTHTTP